MKAFLCASDATRHPPAVLAGVVCAWADVRAAEVQDVGEGALEGGGTIVRRRRPIAPVVITVVDRRAIHVPGIDKVVRVSSPSVGSFCGRLSCSCTTHSYI